MKKNKLKDIGIISMVIISIFTVQPSQARTRKEILRREKLTEEVRKHAQRHVLNKKGMDSWLIVNLYKGNTEGITTVELVQTYEIEYTEANKMMEKLRGGMIINFGIFSTILSMGTGYLAVKVYKRLKKRKRKRVEKSILSQDSGGKNSSE